MKGGLLLVGADLRAGRQGHLKHVARPSLLKLVSQSLNEPNHRLNPPVDCSPPAWILAGRIAG
jgi:hypothetical protein